MSVILRCPVRGCGNSLAQVGARWVCARHHSFDLHRSGYLNLLQSQDRRSRTPGDSKETALARRRLSEKGHAAAVHQVLKAVVRSRSQAEPRALLDVGCGEGAFIRSLDDAPTLERCGLDISPSSIELAAKASRSVLFVVANADRLIPFADRSFDFVISIDARANPAEFARVLAPDGLVLIAVPGPDDLIELRESVQGGRVEKSRSQRMRDELAVFFAPVDHRTVRETRRLDPADLRDLLAATYRGFRKSEQTAVEGLAAMNVTLSHEVLAFKRR